MSTNRDNHSALTCFACGRDNSEGLHLDTYVEGDCVVSRWQPEFRFRGTDEVLHGGIAALLIDEIGAAAAFRAFHAQAGAALGTLAPMNFVTATMTVDYLAAVPMNLELVVRATVSEVTERKAWIDCTVSAGDIPCVRGRLLFVLPRGQAKRAPAV